MNDNKIKLFNTQQEYDDFCFSLKTIVDCVCIFQIYITAVDNVSSPQENYFIKNLLHADFSPTYFSHQQINSLLAIDSQKQKMTHIMNQVSRFSTKTLLNAFLFKKSDNIPSLLFYQKDDKVHLVSNEIDPQDLILAQDTINDILIDYYSTASQKAQEERKLLIQQTQSIDPRVNTKYKESNQ